MEIEQVRITLVNKFCDELKGSQEFNGVCDTLMESIKGLDYIMNEYFGMVFNAEKLKYVKINSYE